MRKLAGLLLSLAIVACGRDAAQMAQPHSGGSKSPVALKPTVGTEPGNIMPPYSTKSLDGKLFDLGSEKGNVVFLNVWATWCGPCRFEIPELQALHEKYAGQGLEVVGVSVDAGGADGVSQFVKNNKMTYPIVLDADGRIADLLRTMVIPTSVIIGRDGRIVYREVGAIAPNEIATVDLVIEHALTKKS